MRYFFSSPGMDFLRSMRNYHGQEKIFILVSYGVDGKSFMNKIEKENVLVDSGAFSVFNSGKKIIRSDYHKFIAKYRRDNIKFINLDVIPRNRTVEAIQYGAEQGLKNYKYFRDRGINTVPVYHLGEDEYFIKEYLKMTSFIALAGNAQMKLREKWFDEVFRKYYSTGVKFHGLGYSVKSGLKTKPFYSVDSVSYQRGVFRVNGKKQVLRATNKRFGYKRTEIIKSYLKMEKTVTDKWLQKGVSFQDVNWRTINE